MQVGPYGVHRLPGDARRGDVDLGHLIFESVLAEHDPKRTEGIGLDHVDSRREERRVHIGHDVRA